MDNGLTRRVRMKLIHLEARRCEALLQDVDLLLIAFADSHALWTKLQVGIFSSRYQADVESLQPCLYLFVPTYVRRPVEGSFTSTDALYSKTR